MLTALLLVVTPLAAAQSSICWDMKPGYSAVSRMVPKPGSERRPEVFYFGEQSSAEACKSACAVESACAAFTWMGASSGGGAWGFGNAGGDAKWARQCYGRGNQVMTPSSSPSQWFTPSSQWFTPSSRAATR